MAATLTAPALQAMAQVFIDSVHHASFKTNGVVVDEVEVYKKERTGATARIYIAIGVENAGIISDLKLYDSEGTVIVQSAEIIDVPANKGIYLSFKYEFREETANA